MWRQLIFVLTLTLSTLAIRVPVDGKDDNSTEVTPTKTAEKKQDTFYVSDDANIDSYLIPPDPHRDEEVLSDIIITPATYLLPPSPEKQIDYYVPTEAGEQTDWYPIAHQAPIPNTPVNLLPPRPPDIIPIFVANNQTFEVVQNTRGGKAYEGDSVLVPLPIPSRQLEPPLESAQNDYSIQMNSEELEIPSEEEQQYDAIHRDEYLPPVPKPNRKTHPKKNNKRFKPAEPTLALHLTPPQSSHIKLKKPTKLYPKKVTKAFHPIPIPIAQFVEEPSEVPRAKPVKPYNPLSSADNEYFINPDEKKLYLYEQAEQKRKLRGENRAAKQQQLVAAAADAFGGNAPAEPETSETNYRHPGRNAYPAPLRQAPPSSAPQRAAPAAPPSAERTEFRMHGMKGPHSYQFGFDTGKGKNRQFRYEERDNDGRVKGHYGYMDKAGKLRVVNYDADPEHGFHAAAPVVSD